MGTARDDAELLEAWRAGDTVAGEALFRRWLPLVYRFFRHKAAEGVDDLVQRTFMACVVARDDIRDSSSFRAYLLCIARNQLYAQLRGDRRVQDVGLSSLAELAPSPSAVVAQREDVARLLAAMRTIPLELRIVVELHYWESCTAAEIAQVIAAPVGTVKTRIRRARELLRTALEQLGAVGPEIDASLEAIARGPIEV